MRDKQGLRMNKSWFSSIFASDKGKGSADQGKDHRLDVGKNNNEVILPSSNLCDKSDQSLSIQETTPPVHVDSRSTDLHETGANISISQNNELERAGKIMNDAKDISVCAIMGKKGDPVNHFKVDTNHQLNISNVSNESEVNGTTNESLTPADKTQVSTERLVESTLSASQTGLKILITSNEESVAPEKKQADKICDSPDTPHEFQQHTGAVLLSEPLVENKDAMFQTGTKDGSLPYEVSQHFINNTKVEIHSKDPLKVDTDYLISSVKEALLIQDKPVNDYNLSKGEVAASSVGKDTIITVEAGPTETAESTNLPNLATEMRVVELQGTNSTGVNNIEIVKSIVYGGLAESITSLSVVSSAAAAGTATLYIFALGVANLIGGFLIILNNLWELKKDRLEQASNQIMEQADRYRELLGHRENFVIHAIVVVLSYTIFGLVPPTVYGYSFRKSDDRELKLIAAAAASLLCIMVLATGKVYAQRPPKSYLKTITFYVVLGFMVSGVSFAAGQLINKLLQKLGLFQSSSEANLFQPGVTPADAAAWASY